MPTLQGSLNKKLENLYTSHFQHPKSWVSLWLRIAEKKSLVARMLNRHNGGMIIHTEGDNEEESSELVSYLIPQFFAAVEELGLFRDGLANNYIFLRLSEERGIKVIEISILVAGTPTLWYWDVANHKILTD